MKKLLNTLFVTKPNSYLSKDGDAVLVKEAGVKRLRLPLLSIGGIVCFGPVGVSPFLMDACMKAGVSVSFLSDHGHFLGRVEGMATGNVLLRREQYRRADNPAMSAQAAKNFITGKVANCRTILRRALRDHGGREADSQLSIASDRLRESLDMLMGMEDIDRIRGIEGEASRTYFGVFQHLITSQEEYFPMRGRNRRPPLDPVNCLLSFLYTLVMHDTASALTSTGFDASVGFLHRDRPGRPGLALDMMEEFRPYLADRLVLSLINLRSIGHEGFTVSGSGAVTMDDDTRKAVIIAYQKRKQEEIQHPFIHEKVTVGLLFHIQARLLARHIRRDLDAYPPFLMK